MKKTLLIGCGNIGFRHLQALSDVAEINQLRITVVEPDENQHGRINDFMATVPAGDFDLLTSLPETSDHFDLAIIATNANVRRSIFDNLVALHSCKTIVFEKVVFQTITDLMEVQTKLDELGVEAFVNCGRRAFPSYQDLRQQLEGNRPIDLIVHGTQYALASNGIHFLDLAEYLNGSPVEEISVAGLNSESVDSKRTGYQEVFGELVGRLENGAEFSLTCLPSDDISINIELRAESVVIEVDEAGGTSIIRKGNQIKERDFAIRHVSGMGEIYSDTIFRQQCILTSYADSVRQHQHFITALRSHLKLSNQNDEPCPIS